MEEAPLINVHKAFVRRGRTLTLISCLLLIAGLAVTVPAGPAGADSATYSSAQIGTTGNTPSFSQGGAWIMTWSYNCSAFGSKGNFIVNVNGSLSDNGTNESGMSGSGTDYYYDKGSFSLAVISECAWTINVGPGLGFPIVTPLTTTSAQIGSSGNSQAFIVGGPWTLAWTYHCSAFGSAGNFIINVNQPPGDFAFDAGVNAARHWRKRG